MTPNDPNDRARLQALYKWQDIRAAADACDWLMRSWQADREPACSLSREARAAMREAGWDGTNDQATEDSITERLRESVLAVDVRSGWQQAGRPLEPDELQLLLCTGGPAVRVWCRLGAGGEPQGCRLQFQDWFTPWETFGDADSAALDWFAGLLYCGEA